MAQLKKERIEANGFSIQIYTEDCKNDYLSLTDIARYKSDEPSDVIKNWMRRKDTIEYLGLWESLNNDHFNSVEFDRIKSEAGYNSFTLSPKKWIEKTQAIGIISKGISNIIYKIFYNKTIQIKIILFLYLTIYF